MYIIKPDLEEEQTEAVIEKFSKLVEENGGQVVDLDRWGKRRLAYEVKNYREGYYVLFHFQGAPQVAQELERVFKISDEVMKYLITRTEE